MPPLTDEKPMSTSSYDKGHHRDHHVEYHTTPDGDVQTVVIDHANHDRHHIDQDARLDHRSDSDVASSSPEPAGWRTGGSAATIATDRRKHSRNLSAHFLDATTLSEGHDAKVPPPSLMVKETTRSRDHPLLTANGTKKNADYPVLQAAPTKGEKRQKATTLQWDITSTEHRLTRETAGTSPVQKSGQKHRRGLSASMNDPVGVAHRRINSSGNAALVERSKEAFGFAARHHQRVDSAGLDMLSSAVADVSNDDIAAVAGVNSSRARRDDSFLPPQSTASSSPPMRGYATMGEAPRVPEHSDYPTGHSAYQHGAVLAAAPQGALRPGPQDPRMMSSHGGFPPAPHPRETMPNPAAPPIHHHHMHAAHSSYPPPQQQLPPYVGHHYHDPGHFRPGPPNNHYPPYSSALHPPTYYTGQRGITTAPPPYPLQQSHGGSFDVSYGSPPAPNPMSTTPEHAPKSVVPSPPIQQQQAPSSARPSHESTMEKIETDEPLFAQKHSMPPPPPPGSSPGGESGQWGYDRSSGGGTTTGVQTHVTTVGVGDGSGTKILQVGGGSPPHRNVGTGADRPVFDGYNHHPRQHNPSPTSSCLPPPVAEPRGHHRKLSSLCSLGPIVFDGGETSGGPHHRSQLSLGGLEEALSVAAPGGMEASSDKFLQNLHASNCSPGGSAPQPQLLESPREEEAPAVGAPAAGSPLAPSGPAAPATASSTGSPSATSTAVSRAYLSGGSSKRVRRKCTVADCTNRVVQGGLCISHGARRKTCAHPGCTKNVKKAGLCSTHGPARRRCDAEGCTKVAVQGGRCIAHGAKKKLCSMEGCTKQAILAGMCKKHHDEHYGIVSVATRGSLPVASGRSRRGTSSPEASDDSSDALCVVVSNSANRSSPPTTSSSSSVAAPPVTASAPGSATAEGGAMQQDEAPQDGTGANSDKAGATTTKKMKPGHKRGLSIFQEMTAVDSIIGVNGEETATEGATPPPPKGHQRGLSIFTDEAVTETIIRQDGNLMI